MSGAFSKSMARNVFFGGTVFFLAQFALSKDEATRGWQKRALRQD